MYLRTIAFALLPFVIAPVTATAATVSPLGGETRVSTGQGFQRIAAPTEFAPGAQVVVSPDGSATIAYSSECILTVKPAGVATVEGKAPCREFPEPYHFGPKVGEEHKTSADSTPPPPPPSPPPATQTPQTSEDDHTSIGTYCLIGGVVVGAGALAAILISQNNSASP